MNRPQEYVENCDVHHQEVKHVLTEYLPLIRWKEEGATIMDIGCGPGNVTVDILLPLLPPNYKQLIGSDISEKMITFAKNKFSKERIEFLILDIQTEEIPQELVEKFDHTFSLFCLQTVENHRQVFSNFNSILKPGGDMLLTFMADAAHYQVYENMYQTEKWHKHMVNYKQYKSPYLLVESPETVLREILESNNFNLKVCTSSARHFRYPDRNSLKLMLSSVNLFVHDMSDNLKEDFLEDAVQRVLEKINWVEGSIDEILVPYKLCVVVAEKKSNSK